MLDFGRIFGKAEVIRGDPRAPTVRFVLCPVGWIFRDADDASARLRCLAFGPGSDDTRVRRLNWFGRLVYCRKEKR